MTAFQSSDINMQNTIRPNLNDDGIQANPFQPRVLPADVKLQAPIQKDIVVFLPQPIQNSPKEETQEPDTVEEMQEQPFAQQPQEKKIPTWGKVLGGVAIAAVIGGVAAYDHFLNNGDWGKNIKNFFNKKTSETGKSRGTSVKDVTGDFFNTALEKCEARKLSIETQIKNLKNSPEHKAKQQDLNKQLKNIKTTIDNMKKTQTYTDNQAELTMLQGKLETKYMKFARKIAEKQESNPNYNYKKDKAMQAKWDKITELYGQQNDLIKKMGDAPKDLQFLDETRALTQKFEYEIKERAKKGELTKNDIYYINGTQSNNSMFKKMKYDDGKLYDFRKAHDYSSIVIDSDLKKENEKVLLAAEDSLASIVSHYKNHLKNQKVLYEVGSQSPEQLIAIDEWSGFSSKGGYDPNLYRKQAANIVSMDVLGCELSDTSDDFAYIAKQLQNEEIKNEFIDKWNESTLLDISDIRIKEQKKGYVIEIKDAEKDDWVNMFHKSYSKSGKGGYDFQREAWSKSAGFKLGKDGSLEKIEMKDRWFFCLGPKQRGKAQRQE